MKREKKKRSTVLFCHVLQLPYILLKIDSYIFERLHLLKGCPFCNGQVGQVYFSFHQTPPLVICYRDPRQHFLYGFPVPIFSILYNKYCVLETDRRSMLSCLFCFPFEFNYCQGKRSLQLIVIDNWK